LESSGAPTSLARNSAAAESEGGQKFLPPTLFLFARPSVLVLRAKRAIIRSFAQKMFELRPKNTANITFLILAKILNKIRLRILNNLVQGRCED
jgi:hypothetical protein